MLMNSDYNGMRRTSSAKHSAIEMMALRFELLNSLDHLITTPAQGMEIRKLSCVDWSGNSGLLLLLLYTQSLSAALAKELAKHRHCKCGD